MRTIPTESQPARLSARLLAVLKSAEPAERLHIIEEVKAALESFSATSDAKIEPALAGVLLASAPDRN